MASILCPIHHEVSDNLKLILNKQDSRQCQAHEAQIQGLEQDISRIDETNKQQWTKIDRMSNLLYSAAPITALLAFVGSLMGAYLRGR
jgi:hypothetical protein